jgi:cyclophilin family peptidyl-prolyl cis-trans isomerase
MTVRNGIAACIICALIVSFGLAADAQNAKEVPKKVEKIAEKIPAKQDEVIMVRVETNLGPFKMELYKDKAPITVENFLNYVNKKFYEGTTFHRVIPNFMIQGGGFTDKMVKKETGPPIKNEAKNGLKNLKYTVAMARTNVVDSATSQFFVNVKDNDFLNNKPDNYGYAVFGKVVEGTKVIDKIAQVATTTKGAYQNVPVKPVIIKSISVATEEKTETKAQE